MNLRPSHLHSVVTPIHNKRWANDFLFSNLRHRGHSNTILRWSFDTLVTTSHREGIIWSPTLRILLAFRAKQQIPMQTTVSIGVCSPKQLIFCAESLMVLQHSLLSMGAIETLKCFENKQLFYFYTPFGERFIQNCFVHFLYSFRGGIQDTS